ncbi:hypothetical protein CFC21_081378 [Triticum aestivum]|uniref:Secreted protein n=2 Tax=Triticum aestivum TaxID=4565 RepID=A0A3B6NIP7_WHEAT|nr:hypothetical protein CFC21_081378 [Triticum aestivum]
MVTMLVLLRPLLLILYSNSYVQREPSALSHMRPRHQHACSGSARTEKAEPWHMKLRSVVPEECMVVRDIHTGEPGRFHSACWRSSC